MNHPLNTTELTMIAEFLEEAANEFEEHSANDFLLPATEENKAIFVAILEHHELNNPDDEHELSVEEIMASTDEVFIYDHWAMSYFSERCKELLERPAAAADLSPSELFAISDLLAYAHEDHEKASDSVCFDLTYPSTEENKVVIAATVALFASEVEDYPEPYRKQVKGMIEEITQALTGSDEIDIPDFWLMYYLADKCEKLSGMPASTD